MSKKLSFKILDKEVLHQKFLQLSKFFIKHQRFDGEWTPKLERELVENKPVSAVILYDPERDTVVLQEQFRLGALNDKDSPWLLEVVAGLIEEQETPDQVARRETKEETGCDLKALIPVYDYWVSPGHSDEQVSLFCGIVDSSRAGGIHGLATEAEDIRSHVLPRHQAMQLLEQGKIKNGIAIIALQWLALHYDSLISE